MAQNVILPFVGAQEDWELARRDAVDVLAALHKLAHADYVAWKSSMWDEIQATMGTVEEDVYGFVESETKRTCDVKVQASKQKCISSRAQPNT